MTGGDQTLLMDVLRPEGRDTTLLAAIRELLIRGGVVAGTSAGAAVMSETAIRGFDDPFDALERPLTREELGRGLGLAPHSVVTDQHFLRRGRVARLLRVLLQSGRPVGLGVEEDSAAVVRGGVALALGARGLLVIDASETVLESAQPLQVRHVRLSYVDRGRRYDLVARSLLDPTTREPPARKPLPRSEARRSWFGDILADNIIVGAMACAAAEPFSATGMAWRPERPLAFEWQLCADERTHLAREPAGDDHTIDSLRLDISPLALAQPPHGASRRELALDDPADVRGE
jgi:cyanophycinase